ncbi:hypothetical protein LJ739_06910 [Aestuariibacter halophilus]|uniref:Uncharacterized protein n=1 Tax=Fluctibacter halophilus TaxID=226011 RepID=A0ABS8G5T1_9ALTE|nr:hypothetical protein [Aestuariibacter halophilus]MCC2615967.1 hypothetical protein [Aestuariibacter halophilus]
MNEVTTIVYGECYRRSETDLVHQIYQAKSKLRSQGVDVAIAEHSSTPTVMDVRIKDHGDVILDKTFEGLQGLRSLLHSLHELVVIYPSDAQGSAFSREVSNG